jgi:hypothetical protein
MSGTRDRRDRRPSDRGDRDARRDSQPDEEQQRRPGDLDLQESDSLTALKGILGKVASLLTSLQLNQDECISLVEQLYGSVLDMDVKLAGETDDKRKGMVLAHIQNTSITRSDGKLVVEYPKTIADKPADAPRPAAAPAAAAPAPAPEVPTFVAAAPVAPEPVVIVAPEPAQLVMTEPVAPEASAPEPAAPEAPTPVTSAPEPATSETDALA